MFSFKVQRCTGNTETVSIATPLVALEAHRGLANLQCSFSSLHDSKPLLDNLGLP